ncbi:unnamed protein product [Musa acuminata subsp. malaccensis]|uniref:(wild Malaysian banana) hypothetical protein n=1 Tax=Musa acuminata subsp. malaccensis TaxID=214687 RepID=A0A804I3A5_MUSAM|nr:unnamed protein product [Musa acuminata subsp. malaccensis]
MAATPAGPATMTAADPPALSRFRPPPPRLPRRSSARPAPSPSSKLLSLPSLTAQTVLHLSSPPLPLLSCRCTYPPFPFSFVEAVAVWKCLRVLRLGILLLCCTKSYSYYYCMARLFPPFLRERKLGKVEELNWLHFCSLLTIDFCLFHLWRLMM